MKPSNETTSTVQEQLSEATPSAASALLENCHHRIAFSDHVDGARATGIWDEMANALEGRLMVQPHLLLLHFLKTASAEQLAAIAGDALPVSENTRSSVLAHLAARIEWTCVQA
ncbi:hypothetical protein K6X12_06565 [Xanthomonas euvesicatoria pv. allii]|uniref:hypothetical protein n=1 Tax=Xanthomonas euvesicatoria TaxID=456327 RepID=UPI00240514AA|nr:hypothetical protein [Xanthomonas euvesicatoria]MCP3050760.1 hypothetical protein [Xanthomonas euvesicatoria pv. allii]